MPDSLLKDQIIKYIRAMETPVKEKKKKSKKSKGKKEKEKDPKVNKPKTTRKTNNGKRKAPEKDIAPKATTKRQRRK